MKTSETFEALLCDPEGNVVIGSSEDKRLLQEAIEDVKNLEYYALHIHKNKQDGTDICAICGFDLRNNIHKRINQSEALGQD